MYIGLCLMITIISEKGVESRCCCVCVCFFVRLISFGDCLFKQLAQPLNIFRCSHDWNYGLGHQSIFLLNLFTLCISGLSCAIKYQTEDGFNSKLVLVRGSNCELHKLLIKPFHLKIPCPEEESGIEREEREPYKRINISTTNK